MIRNIFLPTKIGTYYLFSTRILCVEITSLYVKGMLLVCKGTTKTVEKVVRVDIKEINELSLLHALKRILSSVKEYDMVVSDTGVLPVVFKELTVPFIGKEKIDMILGFEIESALPFALEDAAYDCMILSEDVQKQSSKILVAAVAKEQLYQMLEIFEKAGCQVLQVGVALFGLTQWYMHLGVENGVIVHVGVDATQVLAIHNRILVGFRQIPKGVADVLPVYNQGKEEPVLYGELIDHLSDVPTEQQAVYKAIADYIFPEVALALVTFAKQGAVSNQDIFVQGCVSESAALYLQQKLSFDVMHQDGVQDLIKLSVTVDGSYTASNNSLLATLLATTYYAHHNLLQHFLEKQRYEQVSKQLLVLLMLTIGTLGITAGYSYYLLSEWKSAYTTSKHELDRVLKKQMNITQVQLNQHRQLSALQSLVEETLKREKKLWFAFSAQSEHTYLDSLYELSTTIHRQELNLTVSRLDMTPEELVLYGSVPDSDYDALDAFKQSLSQLTHFEVVDMPRETTFVVKLKFKTNS